MEIKIAYFTGSGNTEFVSNKVKEAFASYGYNNVELFAIESIINSMHLLKGQNVVLGIAYPVYDYKPPQIVEDFIDRLNYEIESTPVFIYSTYTTDPLDSNDHVIDKLQKKNYSSIIEESFRAPGASAFLYGNPNLKIVRDKMYFENDLEGKIKLYVKKVLSAHELFMKSSYSLQPKFNKFNKIHQALSKLIFGTLFYRNLKTTENCNSCGKCVKKCPEKNLRIVENKLLIEKKNGCHRCLKCILECPNEAINFTSSSRKGNYTKESILTSFQNS